MSQVGDDNKAALDLETKKYELEKRKVEIAETRLSDARSAARLKALSIVVPVLLGFATLYWQARTEFELSERQAKAEFELKAAELILNSKSTKAAEQRAEALAKLFPNRIGNVFTDAFVEELKLPGLAYQEKKLELFKTMSANPGRNRDIFRIYAMIYADEEIILTEFIDKWRKLYPEDRAWVDDFSHRWKKAFPEGKWKESLPLASNPAAPAGQKAPLPGR